MSLTFVLRGVNQVLQRMEKRNALIDRAVLVATKEAADLVAATARKKIQQGPKTGRRYGKHQASAPGEAPAWDLGTLARGIHAVKGTVTRGRATCQVVSDAEYSKALEYGTKNKRMGARPFMRPSLEEKREECIRSIKRRVRAAKDGH